MTYEQKFREKEAEFRPRDDFKHSEVVNDLAEIVREADKELSVFRTFSFLVVSIGGFYLGMKGILLIF